MADIISPLPGVFYTSPGPDKPPFVTVGDSIDAGQAVGLVEVMKQFTEIRSEVSGTVKSVEVENGATVNPGTVLVVVDEG
ncbi:acetyl-CoA carboxylase [Nesterenkonia flava]|uniref:Biotin carboxyl carrier protein of acetyl-CoA carboxylase n=1 Tax=Nesterenkonia flava TaxID=469799 RepID=A0ABU1FU86_9MICC|nr:acetyl-CoA carboxylase [Nesterenkonia flava]MDR5712235.1 acetyl-CoA carboxylase [Nesterenkonia flava]